MNPIHTPFAARIRTRIPAVLALGAVALLGACASPGGSTGTMAATPFMQDSLPDAVRVPTGHKVKLETTGVGELTYECRPRANDPAVFEWVFVGPVAALNDRNGKAVGRYYGPPATWEIGEGSKASGAQVAVAPAGAGNIPLQLVKVNPATAAGQLADVAFIQRVAIKGGAAPATGCDAPRKGERTVVKYQADYVFWTPA